MVRGLATFGKQRCSGRLAPPHVCEQGVQLARLILFCAQHFLSYMEKHAHIFGYASTVGIQKLLFE